MERCKRHSRSCLFFFSLLVCVLSLQGQYLELINSKNKLATCNPAPGEKVMPQRVSALPAGATPADRTIVFTYDVHWEASDIKWASRWDLYLKMTDSKIHWFSIVNSIMIVLFLSGQCRSRLPTRPFSPSPSPSP